MKDEPAFKSLKGNVALFPVGASQYPFHLRWLWKVGIPLESKPRNLLSSGDDWGYRELSSSCCAELGVHLDLGRCSPGISVVD